MSALRNRDVSDGPAIREAAGSAPARLAVRALAVPAGPELPAELSRARLLREARIVGLRCRADGADIIALVAEFQACRAKLRKRRLPPDARSVLRSADSNVGADALLDDVLVTIVRGYEGDLELEPRPSPDRTVADRRVPARSLGSSKRE